MRLATGEQALKIDKLSQESGLSAEDLMNEAGRSMAQLIFPLAQKKTKIIIVGGAGHNGGDALVVACELLEKGIKNLSVYLPRKVTLADLTTKQLRRFNSLGLLEQYYDDFPPGPMPNALVVDGIFGVGLNRKVEGEFQVAVEWINSSRATVVSLDLPSGIHGTTGKEMGMAVRASQTVSLLPLKTGLFLRTGAVCAGEVYGVEISFPKKIVEGIAQQFFLMSLGNAAKWWPDREGSANKSKFGRAYVVAGSSGMWGAAILTTRAAFKAGAGYVVHASDAANEILDIVPEAMTIGLDQLLENLNKKPGPVAVGPGVGSSEKIRDLIPRLLRRKDSVVLDADALSMLRKNAKLRRDWIITPHSGELARLLEWPLEKVEGNPLMAAQAAYKKLGCTVVFKGYHTIVVSGYSGRGVIVPTGNVALAKAGTGDVLTGLIAGLLAQKLHPLKAALLGVFIHGLAADEWIRSRSAAAFSASDLLEILPVVMKDLEES